MDDQAQADPGFATMGTVEYRVLGPLTAIQESEPRPLGGRRQRMVLAVLLANANRVVSQDALIDAVWSGEPPEAAKATLQGYISHLRRELGGELARRGDGYQVSVDEGSLDAIAFERRVDKGRRLLISDPARAVGVFRAALALWYGMPYGDLGTMPALMPEVARLEEIRLAVVEQRIEADLAIANHRLVIGELETQVREHPYRERFCALYMLALYRSGRQADALRAYQRLRKMLADELGIDPSAELRDLEQQILEQDPDLDLRSTEEPSPGPTRALRGYEIRDAIGEGDYGIVYRAFQPSVGREVALKVIRPEYVNKAAFVRQFEAEAQLVAQLEHPHAVPLFDFWRDPEGAYLVMPLLRGGSLADVLARGPWNLAPTLRLLEQVGGAAGYAHRQGIVHRDIKPGNVLLDKEGNAYLSDFGVARRLTDDLGAPSTTSLAYVAPEELRGEPLSSRSDIFSLGVLAFHLLSGVHPAGREHLPSISGIRLGLPNELDAVLAQATDDQPSNRFEKVDDFLRALRRVVGADVIAVAEGIAPTMSAAPTRNPYKGLRAFLETDVLDFHGRDALVDEILGAVGDHRLVAVIGPSGSGKSSVVRAGLVPALRAGSLPGSRGWLITDMFPGSYPFEELEAALVRVAVDGPAGLIDDLTADDHGLLRLTKQILPSDDSQLLLIIDQFEELFSGPLGEETRRLFLDSLAVVANDSRSRIRILLTMRADFFDRPLAYPAFAEFLHAGLVTVSPPSGEGLAQAIAGPARRVGIDLEPGLVGRIRADVEGEPGSLPLLQYALTELFDRRENGVLTINAYQSTGGVLRALGRRAEELYQELNSAGKEAAQQLFLRLVTVDENAGDTRRRVRQAELRSLSVDQAALEQVLQQFGSFRLLSFDRHPVTRGPTVEVAHEALLEEWERLKGWIDSQRDDLALHRRLSASARDWVDARGDASFLLRGARLEQAERWAASRSMAVSSEESDFLSASLTEQASEFAATRRRRRTATWSLGAALVVVSLLAAFAFAQSQRASDEARRSEIWNLTSESSEVLAGDPELAMLLALRAADMAATTGEVMPEVANALSGALQASRLDLAIEGPVMDAAATSTLLASVTADPDNSNAFSTVSLLDRATGETLRTLSGEATIEQLAFSPDGSLVAVGYRPLRFGEPSVLLIWDPLTGKELHRFSPPTFQLAMDLAWSPDGKALATLTFDTVTVFDLQTGSQATSFEVDGADEVAYFDSRTVVVNLPSIHRIGFHDSATGAVRRTLELPGITPSTYAIDSIEERIVVASDETREVQLWTIDPLALVWSTAPRAPQVEEPIVLAANATTKVVAVSGNEGTIQLLNLDDGSELMTLANHLEPISDLQLATDGEQLISSGGEGGLRVWDITPGGPRAFNVSLGEVGAPCGVVVSPNGEEAVLWSTDGYLLMVDLNPGRIIHSLPGQSVNFFSPPAVSGDWSVMAWLDENSEGWVRNLVTTDRLTELPACSQPRAFSPDGSMLVLDRGFACAGGDGRSKVIDTLTGREILDLGARSILAKGAVFNPAGSFEPGRYLAVNLDGVVEIYDLEGPVLIASFSGVTALSLALDPTGRYLAIGDEGGQTMVLDMDEVVNGTPPENALLFDEHVHNGQISGVAISAEGIVASATHGALGVWDIHTDELVVEPPVSLNTPPFPAFSPDGTFLTYVDAGYVVRKWYLDVDRLVELGQDRVTRGFTEAECLRYFGPDGCG